MTLTSTYDHRVIQGAESGAFLRRIEQLLQGEDGFYESVAADLDIDAGAARRRPSRLRLGAAAQRAAPPRHAPPRREPDEELLGAVQAATSPLRGPLPRLQLTRSPPATDGSGERARRQVRAGSRSHAAGHSRARASGSQVRAGDEQHHARDHEQQPQRGIVFAAQRTYAARSTIARQPEALIVSTIFALYPAGTVASMMPGLIAPSSALGAFERLAGC